MARWPPEILVHTGWVRRSFGTWDDWLKDPIGAVANRCTNHILKDNARLNKALFSMNNTNMHSDAIGRGRVSSGSSAGQALFSLNNTKCGFIQIEYDLTRRFRLPRVALWVVLTFTMKGWFVQIRLCAADVGLGKRVAAGSHPNPPGSTGKTHINVWLRLTFVVGLYRKFLNAINNFWGRSCETMLVRSTIFAKRRGLGDSFISWKSKKQVTVSRSSTEVEYPDMAMTNCAFIWLQQLLRDFGVIDSTTFYFVIISLPHKLLPT
ncbi:hypothetical protein OSB04_001973 [Centaurea solstitialis]|uniref:Uncharacterized protein n=1 Tax=Centaurea solstitialis TaxID=347529 RepID=A0AA38UA30_9ASTR|nr:hypothetical protein OSB04_001973 [Centaurea solstitialis]